MGRTFKDKPKEKNISNKNASKKLNTKEKRANNKSFKKLDYSSSDYD